MSPLCQGCSTPLVRRPDERDRAWAIRKFCSTTCWDRNRPHGDSRGGGRSVANRLHPGQPCEVCGMPYGGRGRVQRHHIDGDTWNNDRANIAFLCVTHHQMAHKERDGRGPGGGPRPRVAAAKRAKLIEQARAAADLRDRGLSVREVAIVVGRNPKTVRRWFSILASTVLVLTALLSAPSISATEPPPYDGCRPEPASQWAPAGWAGCIIYGEGVASQWPGPGVARPDCVWPWTACPPIRIESVDTGLSVEVRPTMWCMCWVGVTGPQGETARIVDLDPATVAALGLDSSRGLYEVTVYPIGGPAGDDSAGSSSALPIPPGDGVGDSGSGHPPQALLPDTAMQP